MANQNAGNGPLDVVIVYACWIFNRGDFFSGVDNFISKFPVHTFTLGRDAYNNGLHTIAANSAGGAFNPVTIPDKPKQSAPFSQRLDSILKCTIMKPSKSGKGPLDVVIVYAFNCTTVTPAYKKVNEVYWLVHEKLTHFVGSCLGYIYVMSTPNNYTLDMKLVDSAETKATGYKGSSLWRRMPCVKNMASGLYEAHKLISDRVHSNGIILFFSDGLINRGDFFSGVENFVSKFPVHTFTVGRSTYNNALRTIAANSPGGRFNPLPVPDKPKQSAPFSQLLDSILAGPIKIETPNSGDEGDTGSDSAGEGGSAYTEDEGDFGSESDED